MIVSFADNQRLNDALFLDGIGKFAEGFGRKIFARLKGAGADAVKRNALDAFAGIYHRRGCGSVVCARGYGGLRWIAEGRRATQKSTEAAAQSWFCHVVRVSQGRGRCQREAFAKS